MAKEQESRRDGKARQGTIHQETGKVIQKRNFYLKP